jgi:hypothetical protein
MVYGACSVPKGIVPVVYGACSVPKGIVPVVRFHTIPLLNRSSALDLSLVQASGLVDPAYLGVILGEENGHETLDQAAQGGARGGPAR